MRRASGDRRAGIPAPLRQRGKDDHGHEEGEEEDHPPKEARARNEQRLGADPEHRAQRHLSLLWPRRVLVDPVTSSPTRGGALVPIPFANSTVSPPPPRTSRMGKRERPRGSPYRTCDGTRGPSRRPPPALLSLPASRPSVFLFGLRAASAGIVLRHPTGAGYPLAGGDDITRKDDLGARGAGRAAGG